LRLNEQPGLREPLTVIYPQDGVISADYPLMLLSEPKRQAFDRLVAALDVAASQARGWLPGWSLVSGVEMTTPQSLWHWSLLLRAYSGPTPYGQFYRDALSSIGAGIAFAR